MLKNMIKISTFADNIQEKIAGYYYNNANPLGIDATLPEQLKRNAEIGIFQLNTEVLSLQEILANLVKNIILNG